MKEFIFTWFIENISYSWHKPGECIISPAFVVSSMQNTAWTLELYPRGRNNSDYVSLRLLRECDQVPANLAVNFELSFLSADLTTLHSIFIPESFTTFKNGSGFGESRFIKRYEVFDRRKDIFLPRDILAVRCRMWKEDDGEEFGQIFGRTRLPIERIVSVENVHLENSMNKKFYIQSKDGSTKLLSVNVVYYSDDKINLKIIPMSKGIKTSIFKLKCVDKRSGQKICEHVICFFGKPDKELFVLPFSENVLSAEKDNSDANNFEIVTEFVYSTGEEIKMIEEDIPVRIPEFLSSYIQSCDPGGQVLNCRSISKDLWHLYEEQNLCDVELKSQKKSFFVHRIILCARSPVFLAMFTKEMKEKRNNCIEIEDIKPDTLEKFLIFLYTNTFEVFEWDTVVELYYAANKYQVEQLKFICCSYLLKNSDFNNICDLLTLGARHQDSKLLQKAHDFIWKNEERVFKSSMWKEFSTDQPHLAVKTMLSKYEKRDDPSPSEVIESKSTQSNVLDDFRVFYQDQIINDIVIKTKRTTFPAHKTILSVSSPTFKTMFTRICQVKKKSDAVDYIEIKDLEDDTVSQMLLFLYTDSLEDIKWDTAKKLYHAADVYQIQKLKFKCSCFLLENLKVSNAGDLLLLASAHRDLKLQSAVQDYILLFDEEIFASDEWVAFGEANSRLAFETMSAKYKKREMKIHA